MLISSLGFQEDSLYPIEVEVSLVPGPPCLQILGAADSAVKDIGPRIRAATLAQGYEWPRTEQVVVNLRPAPVRQRSRGLDLAITVAVLAATGQIELPNSAPSSLYYGEVSLRGEVLAPKDLFLLRSASDRARILTGVGFDEGRRIASLKDLREPESGALISKPAVPEFQRPEMSSILVSSECADVMAVVAAGEHSSLWAGPSGSGKTTAAEAVYELLADPSESDWREILSWSQLFGRPATWRPKVMPHHTTPNLTMLGGGYPPYPGEVTRAHGGFLLLDEFLEFSPRVQEGLREPLEKGEITLARRNESRDYPARFLLLATTNLCPCGDLTPERWRTTRCQYTLARCRSHLARLSGPMLDRFDVITFSSSWSGPKSVTMPMIYERVRRAIGIRLARGQVVANGRLTLKELEAAQAPWLRGLSQETTSASQRRWRATLRVARTLADLEGAEELRPKDISSAQLLTETRFHQLRMLFA